MDEQVHLAWSDELLWATDRTLAPDGVSVRYGLGITKSPCIILKDTQGTWWRPTWEPTTCAASDDPDDDDDSCACDNCESEKNETAWLVEKSADDLDWVKVRTSRR